MSDVVVNRAADDSPSSAAFRLAGHWPTVLSAIVVLIVAFVAQGRFWVMNGDTSWLITVIDRMHAGDQLFVDIIEVNPPMSVWMYMPVVELARSAAIAPETAIIVYGLLLCAAGVGLTIWIVRAGRLLPEYSRTSAGLALLVLSTMLVGNCFSERDHLGAVLSLPMLALAAWRSRDLHAPRPIHWILAGLFGSAIVLVKPYYVVIVLTAAIYIAVRKRDWRAFLLPEFLLAAALNAAYAVIAVLAYPVFFTKLLPLLQETYLAFRWPFPVLAYLGLPWLILPFATWLLAARSGRNDLAGVLFCASLAALVPYFLQGKGWSYHLYTAVFLGSACLIAMTCTTVSHARRLKSAEAIAIALLGTLIAHQNFLPAYNAQVADLASQVDGRLDGSTVGTMGGDIAVGHPATRMMGGRWIEPYCSDWIATYALRMENRARMAGDDANVAYYIDMRSRYLAGKLARMTAAPPDALIVPLDDKLVNMMMGEYGFDRLLARYTEIAREGPIVVYKLKQS